MPIIDKIEDQNYIKPISESDEDSLSLKSNSEYIRLESKLEINEK